MSLPNMQHRSRQSLEMLEGQSCAVGKVTLAETLPFPIRRIEKKMGSITACSSLIVVMLFIALTGLTFTIYSLYHLQHQVTQMNQINDNPQSTPQKLIGTADKRETKNDIKMAAHLTGKETADGSDRLMWESLLGNAFVEGVTYKDGALVINKTGQYFIYSKIHFRGRECQTVPLHQTILKRDNTYLMDMSLMRVREVNYCSGTGAWMKSTFQAGIFHLNEGVELFVSVSNPTMVSPDELMTFFGLYKV
ncbi:tumor necrosis factor ligand superfamily member 6-like isoform X1 [Pristis pectinata]|uniref:tumor necrosis factor ligand superfamily member 6-like isoform X1 n=1 Tax=Pristis pectinata TaxID=685728 RepID=UPI00223CC4F7|nr:tumor necrosis factor ligand superfamily member 6-like isoform X1 [Pristis pectinata]